jgi:REP element-mobilizing transposase RayT
MDKSSLQYGEYYHIYNRSNNKELLFKEPQNYSYFLSLYLKYIDPIADTLTYCLMPNHVHFVIRIKEQREIKSFEEMGLFQERETIKVPNKKPIPSNQFSHLFSTYSKTINKNYGRTGSLFEHPFERRIIENSLYIQRCIAYVHNNPVEGNLVNKMVDYRWSSFKALTSDSHTNLNRNLVMDLF